MAYSTNPLTTNPQPPANDPKQQGKGKKTWYIILIIALVGTWVFIIYDKIQDKRKESALHTQITASDSLRSAIQAQYDEAAKELDAVLGENTQLQGMVATQRQEIEALKNRIQDELQRKDGDLNKAKSLIQQLKTKVSGLLSEIDALKQQNQALTVSNQVLQSRNDTLAQQKNAVIDTLSTTRREKEQIVEEASTLHISKFSVQPISLDRKGNESETTKAKRASYLKINFIIDENRIAQSGKKNLYIIVTDPEGNVISTPEMGSGSFSTKKQGERVFTKMLSVNYTTGENLPVSFSLMQQTPFKVGTYKVEVFHNGYAVGNGNVTLKKSGLFGW